MIDNPNWLEGRFDLFKRYCLPSVVNQINKNFTWLIFFDITTAKEFRLRIQHIEERHPFIKAVYIDGAEAFNQSCIDEVKSRLNSQDEYVITSRIDNDDAVHQDYISSVQEVFNKQDYCYIDCTKGLTLLDDKKIRVAKITKPLNPFSSLIEKKSNNITTISTKNHDHWKGISDQIQIMHKHLWLQVIHDGNITNQFGHLGYLTSGGYLTSDYDKVKNEFQLAIDFSKRENRFTIVLYNIKLYCYHKLKHFQTICKNTLKRSLAGTL